jgi:uracil phosphoribosyltransferase
MIQELQHPIVKSLVNRLRQYDTDALRFRHIVHELTRFLIYEAMRELPLKQEKVTGWQGEEHERAFVDEEKLLFVTILRAGLPMIESCGELFPDAASGFLAMKRDEQTHQSILYYDRVPECGGKTVIVVDPMVATGGSLCDALGVITAKGAEKIISLNIIGSPEGLSIIDHKFPEIALYIAQVDEGLNDSKFIIPGLGDAGDRAYNTTV